MSDYSPFNGRHREPPTPVLVQRLWRLQKAQSVKVLSCGLYLHPHGIEARCGYGNEQNLLMSQLEPTPHAARAKAEEWKQAAIAKGFEEIVF
jgi:ribosomal protein L32